MVKRDLKQNRMVCLDIAKGIAIISIIIGHLGIDSINKVVYTYHIPVFLLISGYFINDKKSLRDFAISRTKSLMIPYLTTCVGIIILGTIKGFLLGDPKAEFIRWLMASMYGSGGDYQTPFTIHQIGAIWYLPATLLSSVLLRWSLNYRYTIRTVIIFGAFIVGYLSSKYFFWFPMSIQAGACCTLYMYIGWIYKEHRICECDNRIRSVAIIALIILWIEFISQFQGFWLVRNYFGRGIIDIIGSLCASRVVIFLSSIIEKKTYYLRNGLSYLGRYSLLILCVHIIELNLFPWHEMIGSALDITNKEVDYLLLFVKPLVLTVITIILLKNKYIRIICGYPVQKWD